MLARLVAGAKPSTIVPHALELVNVLTDDALLASGDAHLRRALLRALGALLAALRGRGRAALEAAFVETGRLAGLDSACDKLLRALLALRHGFGGSLSAEEEEEELEALSAGDSAVKALAAVDGFLGDSAVQRLVQRQSARVEKRSE